MVARGAPKHFMRFSLDVNVRVILPALHDKRKVITPTAQYKQYQRCYDAGPGESWWLIIGSKENEDLTVVAALGLMHQATIRSAKAPQTYPRPYLWRLLGGSYDALRQNEGIRSGIGSIGMLILTNLAANSSNEKIEKCRDLLALYSDIPRVVTVAGCDPLEFAISKLHMAPTRVLHLGHKTRTYQV